MNADTRPQASRTTTDDPAASRNHVHEILSEMDTMMMVTRDDTSRDALNARPMSVAQVDPDCTIYFLTAVGSQKVEEARATQKGLCTGQTKTRHASVRGTYSISNDRALIARIWSKMADAWFPEGKDDPSVRAIVFHPSEAEVWDLSGAKGIAYMASMVASIFTGEPPAPKQGVHEKIVV